MCNCPVDVFVRSTGQTIKVPCGRCLNCRLSRSNALSCVCEAELQSAYKRGFGASFITLTYAPDFLPPNGSLVKADLQRYIKRLRIKIDRAFDKKIKAKYLACGEYGDSFGRPHYHLVFFGYSVELVTKYADKWSFGMVKILPLKTGGIRYVSKYCMKQVFGKLKNEMYLEKGLEPPFIVHSVNLGDEYFKENLEDISLHNYSLNRKGTRIPLPTYYRKKYDKEKHFNVSAALTSMQEKAFYEGKKNILEWQKDTAFLRERELAYKLRSSGVAADYNYGDSLFTTGYAKM